MIVVQIAPMDNRMYGIDEEGTLYVWNPDMKVWDEA